uniref:Uncharacterized protein n=1 Tax=Salix viminalis TaxID=40686 RepID=A0A6N2KQV2_SALVM
MRKINSSSSMYDELTHQVGRTRLSLLEVSSICLTSMQKSQRQLWYWGYKIVEDLEAEVTTPLCIQ